MSPPVDFEEQPGAETNAPVAPPPVESISSNPIDNPDAWNFAVIGGIITPGVVEVTGCGRKHKWNSPQSKGATGGVPKYDKAELAKITVKMRLWDRDQFALLDMLLLIIQMSLETNPKTALSFDYPEAARNGITSVVVDELGEVKGNAKEGWTYELKLLETQKPTAVAGSGVGAGAAKKWEAAGQEAYDVGKNVYDEAANIVDDMYDALVGDDSTTHKAGPEWIE